ncbi:peptidoglycan DD-metalloendopeptidase family protein [Rhodocyclus tenuis]|uniref:peptidoglycan DD-metalloendopeptidase family protein n=1 Tax=Rhodocyclus tenuis TaxID=1066 RepID=UPI00190576AA|nr:peptidoglycan DD-metalloendopeptidase family protein [Rhodocyclus tenuis]MBK1679501.1 peptidase M23 [Rhodocyclus tenuis]
MNPQPRRRLPSLVAAAVATLLLAACVSKTPAPVVERATPTASAAAAVAVIPAKDLYTVKKGDTLYSIALDNGLDYRELAGWNGIDNPHRILIGQQLRVKAPAAADGGSSEVAQARPITSAQIVEKPVLAGNTEMLKREPKAGKEAYSEQALAQAQGQPPVKTVEPAPAATLPPATAASAPPAKPAEALGPDEIVWLWPAGGKVIATFSEGANKGVDIAGKSGEAILAAGDGKVVYSGSGLRGYGKLVIVKHNATYLSAYAHNRNVLVKEGQSVSKGQKIAEMGDSDADQVKLHFEIRRQGKPVDPLKYLPPR